MKHHYGYHSGLDSPNDWEIRSRFWVELTLNRCFYVNLDWNLESSNFLGVFQGTLTCTYLYNQISRPAYFFDTPADCLFATPSVEFMFSGLGASSKKCRRKNQPEPKNGLLHKTRFQHIPSNKKAKFILKLSPFRFQPWVSAVFPQKGCVDCRSLVVHLGIHWLTSCRVPVLHLLPWQAAKVKWEEQMTLHATFLHPQSFKKAPERLLSPKGELSSS